MTYEALIQQSLSLDRNILNPIELKIYNFLKSKKNIDAEFILHNMTSTKHLLYGPLQKHIPGALMAFAQGANQIILDTSCINFNSKNQPISIKSNKNIYAALGHESLHAASYYDGIGGIVYNPNNAPLNEGITQMLAEKIFNHTASPNNDAYRDLKKIAKILSITLGEHIILDSYFNHTRSLENSCNTLANDSNFFTDLNQHLTALKSVMASQIGEQASLQRKNASIYHYLCVNIIIPKLQSLPSPEKQTKYIASILEAVQDDPQIGHIIQSTLITLGHLNTTELKKENQKIVSDLVTIEQESKLITQINAGTPCTSLVTITKDGKIYLKSAPHIEIINEPLKEKVLARLFFEEQNFSPKRENAFSLNVKRMCENLQNTNTLEFSDSESTLSRKKFLAAIKTKARRAGYRILNPLEDCETIRK